MAISSITFQSNLTATTAGGSTVTSASTSKQFNTSNATADLQALLTQNIPVGSALTTVDVGAVDLTRSHAVRFRNTSIDTTRVVIVVGTMGGTDQILGFMRAGCGYGPEEHPGSGFALPGGATGFPTASAGPTAYKLFTYKVDGANSGDPCVVEVEVVQTGSLVSVSPTSSGDITA